MENIMARMRIKKTATVDIKDIEFATRPLCPWEPDNAHQLFLASWKGGHRVLWFKCMLCTLEYQVRTWRDAEKASDLNKYFRHCPECGSTESSLLLRADNEMGPICSAECATRPARP